ncbi:MAG: enoyl-CoA hydratase-related protein, partial [Amphiplicatus sp.]
QLETLKVERDGAVAQITLNRPDKLNAINDQMFDEIPVVLRRLTSDDAIRAVILTGAGRAFCAGREISELLKRAGEPERKRLPPLTGREFEFVDGLEVPIIAAVNGAAAGAGMGIALLADFRLASESAFFFEAHVARGLSPSVAAWALPRLVGLSKATEMLLLEERTMAAEAERIGLVNRVVADGQLLDEAWKLARRLAALPHFTVRVAKYCLQEAMSASLQETRAKAGWAQVLTRALTDEQVINNSPSKKS